MCIRDRALVVSSEMWRSLEDDLRASTVFHNDEQSEVGQTDRDRRGLSEIACFS